VRIISIMLISVFHHFILEIFTLNFEHEAYAMCQALFHTLARGHHLHKSPEAFQDKGHVSSENYI
jgi:hypothetical protein